MTTPAKVDVGDDTKNVLGALAQGDPDLLGAGLELEAECRARSGLDARSYALVKVAALIALDAPPPRTSGRSAMRWLKALPRKTSWAS